MKIVWHLDGNVVSVNVLQLWDWNCVPLRWIKGNCNPPPLHPLFNPDAGSRTLVSKQLHLLVCALLISFMKTKVSVVLMQERFDLPVPQGRFVFGILRKPQLLAVAQEFVRAWMVMMLLNLNSARAPASVQIFRRVHFNTNELNINYVGKIFNSYLDPFWWYHIFTVFMLYRLDKFWKTLRQDTWTLTTLSNFKSHFKTYLYIPDWLTPHNICLILFLNA